MAIKVASSADMPPEQVEAFNRFVTEAVIDIQTRGLAEHGMSRVSTHLTCLSRLVGMLQAIDPAATAAFLTAMVDIARARRLNPESAIARKAEADYVAAHTRLIVAWELYFAERGQGGIH